MHARRAAIPAHEAHAAAERLRTSLLQHPLVRELAPGPVLVPVRHRAEIDTQPLVDILATNGWTICRPRVRHGHLDAVPVANGTPLEPGYAGIPEPPARLPAIPPHTLHLVLVPGLAFDRAGHRIGYGGGFFDRFLPTVGDAVTIGIGYRFQLVEDAIQHEAHDVPLKGLQLEDLAMVAGAT